MLEREVKKKKKKKKKKKVNGILYDNFHFFFLYFKNKNIYKKEKLNDTQRKDKREILE